ncbi:precorrin-8X methylmutase [Pectinatus haikarae]|uniref:Precorrin-8X/cobalt-precorrin-8 methylmutase n=1 Tax=Pectinatus haikarae TaxID=349096 RepID=A0ABT9Y762_9FIRM|nr:precorrin-8X methylmutase [Pectinatus haikarae]MDQ0203673.1 precorrin-8X/cobalt-precorrin-8 methylmutase [Pectinatus haikarae]
MEFIKEPMAIENRSMEIIAPYLAKLSLNADEIKLYSRMIHASGDVGYADIIKIGGGSIEKMKTALRDGCSIYTDVEMVRTGINKKKLAFWGGEVICKIADSQIAVTAKAKGITRSMAAMRYFGKQLNGAIVAIGNAPTALFEVIRMMEEENIRPAAIIGTPVGFVGAAESKKALAECSLVPFITVEGTKGGSPIAASCVNAVMYMIDNSR